MTTTKTKPVELDDSELEELGIDVPRNGFSEAWRIDDDTIAVLVYDADGGSSLDPPNEDNSGDDAWEWIEFRDGQERNDWRLENSVCSVCSKTLWWGTAHYSVGDAWNHEDDSPICDGGEPAMWPTDILIERYEHGQVRYAPMGESSQVDRAWDVSPGVAVIRFTKPDGLGNPAEYSDEHERLLNFARGICEEYTSWCNGDIYGIVSYTRRPPIDAPHSPILIPDEFTEDTWLEGDSCWGFIGYEYAAEAAKNGDF